MLYLLPVTLWISFSIAIIGSVFVNLMTRSMKNYEQYFDITHLKIDDNYKNCQALYAMAILGLGEILGGHIIG